MALADAELLPSSPEAMRRSPISWRAARRCREAAGEVAELGVVAAPLAHAGETLDDAPRDRGGGVGILVGPGRGRRAGEQRRGRAPRARRPRAGRRGRAEARRSPRRCAAGGQRRPAAAAVQRALEHPGAAARPLGRAAGRRARTCSSKREGGELGVARVGARSRRWPSWSPAADVAAARPRRGRRRAPRRAASCAPRPPVDRPAGSPGPARRRAGPARWRRAADRGSGMPERLRRSSCDAELELGVAAARQARGSAARARSARRRAPSSALSVGMGPPNRRSVGSSTYLCRGMEAATPLPFALASRVRVHGERVLVDGLEVVDEAAVRLVRWSTADPGARCSTRSRSARASSTASRPGQRRVRQARSSSSRPASSRPSSSTARGEVAERLDQKVEEAFGPEHGARDARRWSATSATSRGGGAAPACARSSAEVAQQMREDLRKQFSSRRGAQPARRLPEAARRRRCSELVRASRPSSWGRWTRELDGVKRRGRRAAGRAREARRGRGRGASAGTAKGRTYEEAVARGARRDRRRARRRLRRGRRPARRGRAQGRRGRRRSTPAPGPPRGRIVFEAKDRKLSKNDGAGRARRRRCADRGADYGCSSCPATTSCRRGRPAARVQRRQALRRLRPRGRRRGSRSRSPTGWPAPGC